MSNAFKAEFGKQLFWISPFSPIHSNVRDHAQTLRVYSFLKEKFGEYKIIRLYRDDITVNKTAEIATQRRSSDLAFLHSSGDFGCLHDVSSHNAGSISYPEASRKLLKRPLSVKIVNLPVTVFCKDDNAGRVSLEKDRAVFNDSRYMILCRKLESLRIVREELSCKSMFFPDFVF